MTSSLIVRGDWPGAVVLRAGWARAHARPVNDDLPGAALRLERGSAAFLRSCVDWLVGRGAPAVLSAPVAGRSRRLWEEAGFVPDMSLLLMERDLGPPPGELDVDARPGLLHEWTRAAEIDREAFPPRLRIGRLGLNEAASSTARSRFLVAPATEEVAAFAIVGVTGRTAYLQRLAVDPTHGGSGLGRALVRASLRWARSRVARTMLLNTQPDNHAAISLYRSEGFVSLPERLTVLKATP